MIENDQYYQGIKEKELKHLKRQAYEAEDDQTRLLFLDSIYHAYSTYRYDSAYAYMKQGLELAEKCHNTYYILRNQINRASILSVRGFYGKAESLLQSLNPDEMPYQLKNTITSHTPGSTTIGNHTPRTQIMPKNSVPRRNII